MRTKHTFVFTMLLGLGWVGFLFAHAAGPDPGVNGIFGAAATCDQSGCHNSFPVNSAGGSVALSGLPANGWTPSQTYPLTITIQKPASFFAGAYGFELSSVVDSTTVQAGNLATAGSTAAREQVITGSGIQYAEQGPLNVGANPTNVYFVNWTAPSSASAGTVRFNLAANAANGDETPSGDYIYTSINKVSPAASAPADFSLLAAPPSSSITAGAGTTYTATVSPLNSFTGSVALSVTGLPAGATGSFSSATITVSGNSTLTVATSTAVAAGTYPLTITGISGTLTHSASVSLTVTTPPGTSSLPFTIPNFGGSSLSTDGSGNLGVGYSSIQPGTGSKTPSGVEIIGYTSNGFLVSETGVPASPLITSGRTFAEVNGPVNTGLAIANPNNQDAHITFFFTDTNGVNSATGTETIPANNQLAKFLNQAPYVSSLGGSTTFQGTFSFTSDQPVSVIALRGFTNERSDFLISTLPVIDLNAAANTGTQYIPHFAAGSGWTTQVFLVNPGATTLTGTAQFFSQAGAPVMLSVNGQATNSAAYSVPPNSSEALVTASAVLTVGSVRVVPTVSGGTAPTALALFSYKPAAYTLSEAGAPANQSTAFRMYVESSAASGLLGPISSGIAVANTTGVASNVTFTLFNLDGTTTGLPAPVSEPLPASGQTAGFLSDFFPALSLPFKGVLRISDSSPIAVVGLRERYNQRSDFLITTTPPTNESNPASPAEQLFPHLVNGGGYTTQFILFSGTAGQTSTGTVMFFNTDGTPLFLILD